MNQRGQSVFYGLTPDVILPLTFANGAEIVCVIGGTASAWFGDTGAMTAQDVIDMGIPFAASEKLDNFPHREYEKISFATGETGVIVHVVERKV